MFASDGHVFFPRTPDNVIPARKSYCARRILFFPQKVSAWKTFLLLNIVRGVGKKVWKISQNIVQKMKKKSEKKVSAYGLGKIKFLCPFINICK